MKKTILAVDIGNTKIAMGIFSGIKLAKRFSISTKVKKKSLYYAIKKQVKDLSIDAAIISSVVPSSTKIIADLLKKRLEIETFLLGKDICIPIRNLYKRPKQVGQDRLVNAYACLKLYGAPAIIVDFGTATTFDYINSQGAYSGGLITPGVKISLDALANTTALLPRIELKRPKSLLGKDTVDSMRSGVLYGLSAMCDGVIEKLKSRYSRRVNIIATGGLARFFAPYCKSITRVDIDLTLNGLYLIYSDKIL